MGNGKFLLLFALLLSGLVMNCTQEPLFFDIANEIPPIEPIIGGAPSRIVEMGGDLYVANGSVWKYDGNWYKIAQPPGHIKAVASTNNWLFALNREGALYKGDGTDWSNVGASPAPEQIFGANGYLFAGALTGDRGEPDGYSILSMAESDTGLSEIRGSTGLLTGAVYDGTSYFLGTRGQGIYQTTTPTNSLGTPQHQSGSLIIGLINHNSGAAILAVMVNSSDSCTVLRFNGTNFEGTGISGGFSGAMASWNVSGDWLLLLGLQRSSSSYGYGYREVPVNAAGVPQSGFRIPGESSPSSVILDYQYTNAIGQHAVNALYVMPSTSLRKADGEGRPIIFASTQKNGLWSYRSRGGQPQWNGEDNSLP